MRSAMRSTSSACSAWVLVEEQVQLVEGGPRHLPVVPLVEIAERHRVGQELIEVGDAALADFLVERDRQPGNPAEQLDLARLLVEEGSGALRAFGHDVTMHTSPLAEYAEQSATAARDLYAAPHRLTRHRLVELDRQRSGGSRPKFEMSPPRMRGC